MEQALAQINISAATEQEIRNAAYSGKIITTHQHQINFHGWIGEGYIIIDPTTGAGAYKIAGGGNGGFMILVRFLIGWWLSFSKKNPALAKAIGGSVALVLTSIFRFKKLLEVCPIGIAAIGIIITIGWNILFLSFHVSLIASGVGIGFIFLLSGLESWLEKLFVDKFIEKGCES